MDISSDFESFINVSDFSISAVGGTLKIIINNFVLNLSCLLNRNRHFL